MVTPRMLSTTPKPYGACGNGQYRQGQQEGYHQFLLPQTISYYYSIELPPSEQLNLLIKLYCYCHHSYYYY